MSKARIYEGPLRKMPVRTNPGVTQPAKILGDLGYVIRVIEACAVDLSDMLQKIETLEVWEQSGVKFWDTLEGCREHDDPRR